MIVETAKGLEKLVQKTKEDEELEALEKDPKWHFLNVGIVVVFAIAFVMWFNVVHPTLFPNSTKTNVEQVQVQQKSD